MTEIRGLMSPRRSSRTRGKTTTTMTAPPNSEEQQRRRRNDTNLKRRPSNSSGIYLAKSTLKIASASRPKTEQPSNNSNTKTATTKSLNTPSMTVTNLKGGFGSNSSNSHEFLYSPHGSPKSFQSLDRKDQEFGSSRRKAPRILYKIYKEIATHRQGNSSITSYFRKLKELWGQLSKAYNDLAPDSSMEMLSDHMEREKVLQFLVGLNESYSSICCKILLMRPFPTVDTAFSIINQKENRRKLVISSEEVDEEEVIVQAD